MIESPAPPPPPLPFGKEWDIFAGIYAKKNDLSPEQMNTVRSVFYAGALCMNSMLHTSIMSSGPFATSALISQITAELNAFADAQMAMLKTKMPKTPENQNN